MARANGPVVTIRTTSDGGGYPHGVVAGMGTSPFLALEDLKKRARAAADQILAAEDEITDGADPRAASRDFEVAGVLLTSGLLEDGYPGWCAYGTLREAGPGSDYDWPQRPRSAETHPFQPEFE
jgi:hypothetical protein